MLVAQLCPPQTPLPYQPLHLRGTPSPSAFFLPADSPVVAAPHHTFSCKLAFPVVLDNGKDVCPGLAAQQTCEVSHGGVWPFSGKKNTSLESGSFPEKQKAKMSGSLSRCVERKW